MFRSEHESVLRRREVGTGKAPVLSHGAERESLRKAALQ
jgi:hypothetical protein